MHCFEVNGGMTALGIEKTFDELHETLTELTIAADSMSMKLTETYVISLDEQLVLSNSGAEMSTMLDQVQMDVRNEVGNTLGYKHVRGLQ